MADALGFLALGFDQTFDFDLELPAGLAEANVLFVGVIAALAVIEPFDRATFHGLGREVETWGQHLLHQQACSDRLQCIVDCLGHGFGRGVGLRDKVGEPRSGLALGIAGGAADDLHDLRQAGAITHRQGVFAPDPIEPFFRHTQGDDDVDMIAVVLLRGVFQRGGNLVTLGWLVVHQIGDA